MTAPFDIAPLLAPGTPAPAAKFNGFPKYNFVGGHNDAKHVPVQALIDAATSVLKREGTTLATYGLNSGPLGYKPLREFLSTKLKSHAGIECAADEILITSGSLQGLDLINTLLLAKGDTVLIEQETYGGALSRLAKFGVNIVGIPLDDDGMRMDALRTKLEAEADALDSGQRGRIEGVARSLTNRCELTLEAWRAMLRGLHNEADPVYVDWFAIERSQTRETDVGMYRHYLDPTEPFVNAVIKPSHGAVITSATLRDNLGPAPANDELPGALGDWLSAEARTGTRHLQAPAVRAAMASPFDYAANTKVIVVKDVKRDDSDQVAAAYRELFLASGGGALGLFTAIGRLRAVHQRIAPALEEANLPLYAQHVGGMDAATLVDIFRAEEHSCLLGTDAVRDGVDVPGRSLRLIVFDRVPWPRPDILHRARKAHWKDKMTSGGAGSANAYDDMLARLRLKQAYGRLIRRADDRGVFVMLDSRLPSRLLGAFPAGVEIQRTGLADAVAAVRGFLNEG